MTNHQAEITELERDVLIDIHEGRDPWRSAPGTGSRRVSQAIGRLKRKEILKAQGAGYVITDLGQRVLERAR